MLALAPDFRDEKKESRDNMYESFECEEEAEKVLRESKSAVFGQNLKKARNLKTCIAARWRLVRQSWKRF